MGTIQKDSGQQKKTEAKDQDQLAIKMLSLDSAKYSLSVMKSNP
jgi:hypothetical protein